MVRHLVDERPFLHYSFDLWGTLIKSDPQFKKERSRYFFENFNPLQKSLEEIEITFRRVDVMCNAINEKTGHNIRSEEMYLMVLAEIGETSDFSRYDLVEMNYAMENLAFTFMPVIYDISIVETLSILRERKATISLLSNTAFITGQTLRKILKRIGLAEYFTFQLYSDETGFSKPSLKMFEILYQHVLQINRYVGKTEIIHIGDNSVADIGGAVSYGIQSYLVNTKAN